MAPAAHFRSQLIPTPGQTADHSDTRAEQRCDHDANADNKRRSRWRPWAELLKRSFDIDLRCPRCNASMKLKSFLTSPKTLQRLLTRLGESTEVQGKAPARGLRRASVPARHARLNVVGRHGRARVLALAPNRKAPLRPGLGYGLPEHHRSGFAVTISLIPSLLRELRRELPLAHLRAVTIEREVANQGLANGEVDLLIGIPPYLPAGCEGEQIYEEQIVCILRRDHPTVRAKLSLDQYVSLPHIEVELFGEPDERVDRALARVGRTRAIALTVPHFSSVPFAVANSDCVAALGRRIARAFAKPLGLRIVPAPVELPRLYVQQVWHRRTAADPGVTLLRALTRKAASERMRSRI